MKKKVTYTIILFIIIIVSFTFLKYRKYSSMKSNYYPDGWLTVLPAVMNFYEIHNSYPNNPKEFDEFINKDYFDKEYLLEFLHIYKYNIMYRNDSLYIYSFGFDNDDDNCSITYHPNEYPFYQSFFIGGDIVLFKHRNDFIEWNKQEIKRYKDSIRNSNAIPQFD